MPGFPTSVLTTEVSRRNPLRLEEEIKQRTAELAEANEALRQGQERWRLAMAAGHMVSWDWEISTGRVILSQDWEALHGIPAGTFAGTFEAYLSDIHPEDREAVMLSIRSAVELGSDHHAEYRLIWPDGSVHWIEARGRLLRDTSGKPARMIGICMDIRERKHTEQSLHEFLAMLAHELRNPLAPIRSGLDLLSAQGIKGTVGLMQEQLDHLVRLVDDLLDVSRIVRGDIPVHHEKVRLNEIVQRRARRQPSIHRGTESRTYGCHAVDAHLAGRRSRAVIAGRRQPAQQRRQVHREGWTHLA